jgi:hypothetical protein
VKVTVDIAVGNNNRTPTKCDIQDCINTLQKAIDLKPLSGYDTMLLMGVQSVMEGIKEAL